MEKFAYAHQAGGLTQIEPQKIPFPGDYHSYDEIVQWLQQLERFYPQLAQTFVIGTTHEGRSIRGIKVGK